MDVDRDRLVLGLAAVFAGLTTLLAVAALAEQPFLLLVAVPFAVTTYFLWYHASGRLATRTRSRRAGNRRAGRDARGGFDVDGTTDRSRRRSGPDGPGADARASDAGSRADATFSTGPSRAEAHRILGVEPGADSDVIRRAYRNKVKEVHPDAESGDEDTFKRVNRAYERLHD